LWLRNVWFLCNFLERIRYSVRSVFDLKALLVEWKLLEIFTRRCTKNLTHILYSDDFRANYKALKISQLSFRKTFDIFRLASLDTSLQSRRHVKSSKINGVKFKNRLTRFSILDVFTSLYLDFFCNIWFIFRQ